MSNGKISHITVNYKTLEKVVIPYEYLLNIIVYGLEEDLRSIGKGNIERVERAEYISLQIEKFEDDKSKELSEIYSRKTPYERLTQDTLVDSITFNYIEDDKGEEIEVEKEVYVPYNNTTPDKLGKNEWLEVTEKVIERPYYEPKEGVEMVFNKDAYPYPN